MAEFDAFVAAHRARRAEAERERGRRAAEAPTAAQAAAERIGRRIGVHRVWLFGSLARGRFRDGSDIDRGVEGLPPGA